MSNWPNPPLCIALPGGVHIQHSDKLWELFCGETYSEDDIDTRRATISSGDKVDCSNCKRAWAAWHHQKGEEHDREQAAIKQAKAEIIDWKARALAAEAELVDCRFDRDRFRAVIEYYASGRDGDLARAALMPRQP